MVLLCIQTHGNLTSDDTPEPETPPVTDIEPPRSKRCDIKSTSMRQGWH